MLNPYVYICQLSTKKNDFFFISKASWLIRFFFRSLSCDGGASTLMLERSSEWYRDQTANEATKVKYSLMSIKMMF